MKLLRASLAIAGFLLAIAPCLAQSTVPVVTHVVDTHGNPIAGASVYISQWESYDPPTVLTTDKDGAFKRDVSVSAREEPPVQCVIVAKGYGIGGCVLYPEGDHTVTLTSSMTIHGKVVDANNHPIADTTVDASYLVYGDDDVGLDEPIKAKTDAKGAYTLDGLPRNAKIQITVDDPRFDETDVLTDVGAQNAPPIVVKRGIDLVGRVLLPNGKPAANIRVQANNGTTGEGWRVQEAVTGIDGYYHITGLPAGHYNLFAKLTDAQSEKWDETADTQVSAAAGRPTRVPDIKLTPASKKKD